MADYRIVCTTHSPVDEPSRRTHIVAVGTGTDPGHADIKWSLDDVLLAIRRGDRFYVKGERSARIAWVEPYVCSFCRRTYIRTTPDDVTDNNLDNLRRCQWQT